MSIWRKTILATAIVGAGLASTTGAAFAGESDHKGEHGTSHHEDERGGESCTNGVEAENGGDDTTQSGFLNVDDVQTIVPINACGNNVPVNVLGIQVPIQDGALNLPIASGVEDGENSATTG